MPQANPPSWRCYCGLLSRLKFRSIRCIVCRTECLLREPSEDCRLDEMSGWLADDYRRLDVPSAVRLTLHTSKLVGLIKNGG